MKPYAITTLVSCLLAGCASDCNLLSGNSSPACQTLWVTLAVVSAPVALPYALIKNASNTHADIQSERDMRRGVEAGEPASSERCIFACRNAYLELKDERWKLQRQAAEQIIAADQKQQAHTPRQQAVLFAAHKVLADALWREAPALRIEHLHKVVRLGQSRELWAYVKLGTIEDNDFPVNAAYFRSAVEDTVIDLLNLQREAAWQAGDRAPLTKEACDLTPFGLMPALADRDHNLLCHLAASDWKRRHPIAQDGG